MTFFSLLESETAKTSLKDDRSKKSEAVRISNFMRDNLENSEIVRRSMNRDRHHPIQFEHAPEASDKKTSEAENKHDQSLQRRSEKERNMTASVSMQIESLEKAFELRRKIGTINADQAQSFDEWILSQIRALKASYRVLSEMMQDAGMRSDAPESPQPRFDLSETSDVPVKVNPALADAGIRAQAVGGNRIELAHAHEAKDDELMLHEKRHIAQQQMARCAPASAPIVEDRAERDADDPTERISPCNAPVLTKKSDNCAGSTRLYPMTRSKIDEAIEANADMMFRTDFILRLKAKLKVPIDRSSRKAAVSIDKPFVCAIAEFQSTLVSCKFGSLPPEYEGMTVNGIIDAPTRLALEDRILDEAGKRSLIGRYAQIDPKNGGVILSGANVAGKGGGAGKVPKETYERCREIIENWGERAKDESGQQRPGGYFDATPGRVNILAIRSAKIVGDKIVKEDDLDDNCRFWSSRSRASACKDKPHRRPYNDVMLTIWRTEDKDGYYVNARVGSVDPGSPIGDLGCGRDIAEKDCGTSHLRDGQYVYKRGMHGTTSDGHKRAILKDFCVNGKPNKTLLDKFEVKVLFEKMMNCDYDEDTTNEINVILKEQHNSKKNPGIAIQKLDFIETSKLWALYSYESKGGRKSVKLKIRKVRYNALVAKEPTEVFREMRTHESGLLTHDDENHNKLNDIDYSRAMIANNNEYYRDTDGIIGINVHSGIRNQTSSQGCQNIPSQMYKSFYSEIESSDFSEILYTVIDASKIKEEL